MAQFEKAITKVLKSEGGYVNDPKDKGGETNFGISKRAYPNEDIKNLTVQRAKELYKRDYWDAIKGDDIVSNEVAYELFDTAVNMGSRTSVKIAQLCLGVEADGVIGAKTVTALNLMEPETFILKFKMAKIARYVYICKKNPDNKKFFFGWINRVMGV